ncbi:MAG: dockerin type I repeat-containing protein [Ruminococcus sp.]
MKRILKYTIALLIALSLSFAAFIPAFALSDDEVEILPGNPSDYQSGDVNLDGKIDIKDASMIQKYLSSIITLSEFQKELSDVNGDGKINIIDSTQIQRILAGLSTGTSKDDDKPIELPIIPVIR